MCVVHSVPLRKHGCVGANPSVGQLHSSISSSGGKKKTSSFQQVEHTQAEESSVFRRLRGGLCGPRTFSPGSQLTRGYRAPPTPTTDVFTHSHRRPQRADRGSGGGEKQNISTERSVSFTILKNCVSSWDVKSKFTQVEFRGS